MSSIPVRAVAMVVAIWIGGFCALSVTRANAMSESSGAVAVTMTTSDLHRALTQMPAIDFLRRRPLRQILHVDASARFQRVTGFGAAMTDSSAWLIAGLPDRTRDRVMQALFGPTGDRLSFVRVSIGASDFSATGEPYSYDDLPLGESDPTLARFSIAHDEPYVLPVLRQMLVINPRVWVLGSPWTAPPWMKANDAYDNLYQRGFLLPEMYGPYARYFVKFVQAYRNAGVSVNAVTPQNEPNAWTNYPGMMLDAPAEITFVTQYLRPALADAGLPVSIYGLDTGPLVDYARKLLTIAPSAFAGIAWHCYGGQAHMPLIHAEFPKAEQIISECSPGIIPYGAAQLVISATRNWATRVALWNIALNSQGGPVQPPNYGCPRCTGLVTIDGTSVRYLRNYYELGQISRFVRAGAIRIQTERWVSDFAASTAGYGVTTGLDNVAFLNPDGSKVLVAYNSTRHRVGFAIAWRNRYASYSLPGGSTATFTWR